MNKLAVSTLTLLTVGGLFVGCSSTDNGDLESDKEILENQRNLNTDSTEQVRSDSVDNIADDVLEQDIPSEDDNEIGELI